MKTFESADYGTPIEELPGVVGYSWDGNFYPGPKLKILADFDWLAYNELREEIDEPRRLVLAGLAQPTECEIKPYTDLAYILDQIPSLEVMSDSGPADGMAAGSGYIFFLKGAATFEQLQSEITSLRHALDTDLLELLTSH
jgi:hypothetical protein